MPRDTLPILQEIAAYCGSLAEDLAVCAEAATLSSHNQLKMAEDMAELKDLMRELVGKVGQLYDAQCATDERLGNYIRDQAKHDSGVREVDRRLKLVEQKIGQ